MLKQIRKRSQGFTIIEVMIVLAIAALILVVVLIAIPQLQRNQRNSARRDIVSRIKAELDNYAGNNNGSYPAANAASGATNWGTASNGGFQQRYLGNVNINDPQTGSTVLFNLSGAVPSPLPAGTVAYRTSQVCNGETMTGGSPRNYALQMGLEGGASFCVDNR